MRRIHTRRYFYKDDFAVSEEFTSLPALVIVMVGFTLFMLLMANTYSAYDARADILKKYQTADFLATKLTNLDCQYILEGGLVDLTIVNSTEIKEYINSTRETYRHNGIDFILRLRWDAVSLDIPALSATTGNRVAVSRDVSIVLNEVQTVPGKLTIITWGV